MARRELAAAPQRMQPEDDPGWASYGETILRVHAAPPFEVDLARPFTDQHRRRFRAAGLPGAFGILTPENPRGRATSAATNAGRLRRFHEALAQGGHAPVPVDGLSPDRSRVEHGVALSLPRDVMLAMAEEWEQSAIYWCDGEAMWVLGALTHAEPWRLGPT
jgi:hypothetical protein